VRRLLVLAAIAAVLILPGDAVSLVGVSRFRTTETSHIRNGILEVWSLRILLLRSQQIIGSGVVACARVGAVRQCAGTYTLPSGQVAVQGKFTNRDRIVFVITGGTESYIGVKGVVISTQYSCCPRRAFLTFYFSS
jgi:hypothetical protein